MTEAGRAAAIPPPPHRGGFSLKRSCHGVHSLRLRRAVAQGRLILSLNDVPEVRELFSWADIERVSIAYKANGTKRIHALIILA